MSFEETLTRVRTVQLRTLVWGASTDEPSVPMYYPLLAVLVIVGSIPATVWFLSSTIGYLIALAVLSAVVAYAVLFTALPWSIDLPYLALIGGYWLGLVAHYFHWPHAEIIPYIALTPLVVFGTIVVFPRYIDGGRTTFTGAIAVVAVLATLFGIAMLFYEFPRHEQIPEHFGDTIFGLWDLRMVSVFHGGNTFGFFMMVGSLAAIYTFLTRRGILWLGATGLCLLGLLLSEGDAALLGFVGGFVLLLSGFDRRYGYLGLGAVLLGAYVGIRVGHVPEVMQTTLQSRITRWVLSIERLSYDPLWGTGFVHHEAEIGHPRSPHNSYVRPLLNTGIIFGGLYLTSFIYALVKGIRKAWTPWNTYVVGTAVAVFAYMMFEELFLGGLSVSSIVLGIVLGLLLLPDEAETRYMIGDTAYGSVAARWVWRRLTGVEQAD